MKTTGEKTAVRAGLHVIIPVWGEAFTRCFVDICLPSLLAPGNIPALPYPDRHIFQIYTSPTDRAVIEGSAAYARLCRHMRVTFHAIRALVPKISNPHLIQSDCFRRGISDADATDSAMIFLTPDLVIADGSLTNLARIAEGGARAVLATGIRLNKDEVAADLIAHHRSTDGAVIAIGARDLVRLALPNLHPIARAHFFAGDSEGINPANLMWPAGEEGVVARCFHLHPFLVYPRVKQARFRSTIDDDYLQAACPDPAEIHIVTDSDEFVAFELSGPSHRIPLLPRAASREELIKWAAQHTSPRHRELIGHVIRIHRGIETPALWHQAEAEAQAAVSALLTAIEPIDPTGAHYAAHLSDSRLAHKPISLHLATSVLTSADADLFADVTLPSVLAPSNAPSLPNKQDCLYRIMVATPEARVIVERSPALAVLREHMPVTISAVDAPMAGRDRAMLGHKRRAMKAAAEADAAAVFLDPGMILADHSLLTVSRGLRSGLRAVLCAVLRVTTETLRPVLGEEYWAEGVLAVMPAELAYLAFHHLHPVANSHFFAGDTPGLHPANLYWPIPNEGLLAHCFDLHAIAIYPRPAAMLDGEAGDDLVADAMIAENEIGVLRDSSAFLLCRMSDGGAPIPVPARGGTEAIAAWAIQNTTPFQRQLFRYSIGLTVGTQRNAHWHGPEAEASAVVAAILEAVERQRGSAV